MPFQIDMLAVALHLELLQVRRKTRERGRVWHDPDGLRAEEIVVPDRQKPQQQR